MPLTSTRIGDPKLAETQVGPVTTRQQRERILGYMALAREAGERWQIVRIAISHRVGLVNIGETSVAIAVSAAHRGEAFEACRFAIDRLKEVVPIWKKEYFEGGEVWIGCQTSHPPAPN